MHTCAKNKQVYKENVTLCNKLHTLYYYFIILVELPFLQLLQWVHIFHSHKSNANDPTED